MEQWLIFIIKCCKLLLIFFFIKSLLILTDITNNKILHHNAINYINIKFEKYKSSYIKVVKFFLFTCLSVKINKKKSLK